MPLAFTADYASARILPPAVMKLGVPLRLVMCAGLGEDADSLRASFSKRTRQLKLTMPILVGQSECHSSTDEPAMDQLSAGGSATGSTPSMMRMEGQNDRQPGKGLGFADQNPASAVDPCITDDTYTAEDVRRRMAAMLSEASRSLPDTAIRYNPYRSCCGALHQSDLACILCSGWPHGYISYLVKHV